MKQKRNRLSMYIVDQHIPYMDPYVDELEMAVAKTLQPDELIFGGDLVDFWQVSKFNNNPLERAKDIQYDADLAFDYLRKWPSIVPKAKKIFQYGNHEHRIFTWMAKHPNVATIRGLDIPSLLQLEDAGIDKWTPYIQTHWTSEPSENQEHWVVPEEFISIHGHRYSINAGFVGNYMLRDYGCSGMSGHNHKRSYTSKKLKRKTIDWWEIGCSCMIYPNYAVHSNWQHGFGLVSVRPDNTFECHSVRILPNYTCHALGTWFNRKGPM